MALGEGGIDWQGQIDALASDSYSGYISLETHWQGPDGDKLAGSLMCAAKLRELAPG